MRGMRTSASILVALLASPWACAPSKIGPAYVAGSGTSSASRASASIAARFTPPSALPKVFVAAPMPPPCELASNHRARVKELLARGKLDRAVRVMERADALCPSLRKESRAALVTTLAELGRYDEARAVAGEIEGKSSGASKDELAAAKRARAVVGSLDRPFAATDAAKKPMRLLFAEASRAADVGDFKKAKAKFLAAWSSWRPNGQALFGAGLAAKKLGDEVEAQKLFDRAIVDLEKATASKLTLDAPNGFGDVVRAPAWGAKGALFAVAHDDVISIYDGYTFRERFSLRGHTGFVLALSFSPDGKTLASGARDGTVRLWDATSGKSIKTLLGHTREVTSIAFSSDGKKLASGSDDKTVRVWDASSGAWLVGLVGHADAVTSIAFSPDGTSLASASVDRSVRLWDVASGKSTRTLSGHGGDVTSVAFAPDGKTLASSAFDKTVRLWDVASGNARVLEGHSEWVRVVAFSRDGKRLASASDDRTIRLWDPTTGASIGKLVGHTRGVEGVAFNDAGVLASTSFDGSVRLWDSAGKTARTLERHAASVASVAYAPKGRSIAIAGADGVVRAFDLGDSSLRSMHGHTGAVLGVAYSPDGELIASASADSTLRLWSASTFASTDVLTGHGGAVDALAFAPNGKALASGSADKTIRFWAVMTGDPFDTLSGHGDRVSSLAFAPDGAFLASASSDQTLRLWNVASGLTTTTLTAHIDQVTAVAFSPDGASLVSGALDSTLRVWDPMTGAATKTLSGHTEGVKSVAFSRDGRLFASGAWDKTVRVWDPNGWTTVGKLEVHEGATSLAFSPDQRALAVGGWEGTTTMWSLPDHALSLSLRVISGRDAGYAFTPSGDIELFGDAREFPICRVGALSFAFDLCEERFLRRGLIRAAMEGAAFEP